jgi:hypothetical protein
MLKILMFVARWLKARKSKQYFLISQTHKTI